MARWRQVAWRRWSVKIGLSVISVSLLYLLWILPAHSRHMQWPTAGQWMIFWLGLAVGIVIYCIGYTWDDPYRRK